MSAADSARTAARRSPIDVWLDVDPAAGLPEHEVDDALAMIQAFHSPELCVRGVSVVYGNADLVQALPIGREVAARFGPAGLGVHAGAARREELGAPTPAVEAIAAALRERPLTLLALGPLTNVATVVTRHPELQDRIERMVVVAGRRPGQEFRASDVQPEPFPDFNFENDPEAARVLLESPVPLVLAPWEVSSHVLVTTADLDELGRSGEPGAWLARNCRSWLGLWRERFHVDGFNPFDTLAVSAVTHPALIASVDVALSIEPARRRGAGDGGLESPAPSAAPVAARRLQSDVQLIADVDRPGGRRATYCYKPSPELKPILLERLARRPR